MSCCDRITQLLAQDGPAALRDDQDAQEHIAGCDACYELLVGVQELEQELSELPTEPIDPALRERVVAAARITAPGALAPIETDHGGSGASVEDDDEPERDDLELDEAEVDDLELDEAEANEPEPSEAASDEQELVEPPAAEATPGRVGRVRRLLRFVHSHPRPAVGALAALLLAMVTVPTVFMVTWSRGGSELGLYDSAPDRFIELRLPAEEAPAMAWDEAPERTATLPAIGSPRPGKSSASGYGEDDMVLDLLSDGDWEVSGEPQVRAGRSRPSQEPPDGLRGGGGGDGAAGAEVRIPLARDRGEGFYGKQDAPRRSSGSGRRARSSTDVWASSEDSRDTTVTTKPSSAPPVESSGERLERLSQEVTSDGLLALLGTTGSSSDGAAVADLLSDAEGLDEDVGRALAGSSGVSVAVGGIELGEAGGARRGDFAQAHEGQARPVLSPEPTPEPIPDWSSLAKEQPEVEQTEKKGKAEAPELPKLDEVTLSTPVDPSPSSAVMSGPNDSGYRLDRGPTTGHSELDGRLDDLRQVPADDGDDAGRAGGRDRRSLDTQAAQEYLADNQATDNVHFQRASGYWENRYVPGDPTLRRLHRRLTESDRGELGLPGVDAMMLDSAARQYSQPFDRPTDSALAVFLHGDRRGVQGETRMRLQVGIQATERGSGRRTAMNVGVVLDLRVEPDADDAAAIRALLEALSQARDSGDTISLTVAGRPGGMVLPPGDFRYGPVAVALEELLSDRAATVDGPVAVGPALTLPMALRTAATSVQSIDDPSQPLGSSLVLLVSAGQLNGQTRRLASIAHSSAVAGVPVSVVGVGDQADLPHLEEIALAGQGNRRLMSSPGEARDLVDRELTAVSHVVARAVRLRIKLAPGVKLVDVLGSQRLDAIRAERVREAERSIDVRLSKNLGIEADRGEDEEGVQIVVPTWYSGDAHVVLLDVVVPGPGPVAEVTVRYKDLVHLRNGVARSSLRLTHDASQPGPLEHNVVRNVLAMELSDVLASASQLLEAGRETEAVSALREFVDLVHGLQVEEPALYADPEVDADLEMVAEYLALLDGTALPGAPPMAAPAARAYVRDSLEYAAFNKINPRIQSELE